jgi:hypothetical protein
VSPETDSGAVGGGFTDRPEDPRGRALYDELLWVHGRIRQDLESVERLAVEALDGRPAEELAEELKRLETSGPLWKLKYGCLHYCRFVHAHHNAEDVMFFPRVRAANPAMAPVIERLEAEHREVSDLLDRVELGAGAIGHEDAGDEESSARVELAAALRRLADHLLAHLSFEEEHLRPTLVRMPGLG